MPTRMCKTCNVRMVVDDAAMSLPAVYCPMCAKGPVSFQTPVPPANPTPVPIRPPTVDLKAKIRQKLEEEQRRATTPQPAPPPPLPKQEAPKADAPPRPTSGPKIIIRKPGSNPPPEKV